MEQNKNNIDIRAYQFSIDIVKFIRDQKTIDFTQKKIFRQLIRSATSIGANIYEAKGGNSRKYFTLFLGHALKSSIETCYWLRLLKDGFGINDTDKLTIECEQLSKILGKSIITLRNKQ